MRAKLSKIALHDGYRLDDENGLLIASTLESSKNKISLKNCEAIERGYDLDELAENKWNELSKQLGLSIQDKAMWCGGFKHGLLELLGDKKFSEDDVIRAIQSTISSCSVKRVTNRYVPDELLDEVECSLSEEDIIQELQQTEWDVEILEVEDGEVYSVSENMKVAHDKTFDGVLFKYDADGCLILKRK